MVLQNFQEQRTGRAHLQNGSNQQEDFLACLSFFAHEARNPLLTIEQSVQVLLERPDASPAAIESYKRILVQVEEIKRLLKDVGEFSAGNVELKMEPTDLGPVVLHAVELVRPLFEAKSQNFLCVVDPMPIRITGDPGRLVQVFSNLLANASRYSPSHSKVEITAHHVGDSALVFVRDEGIGLEAKDRDQIFDLSYRGARTEPNEAKVGSIGLALVSQLVKLHHGTVEAKSDGVARGSEFIVRLPIDHTYDA